MNDPSLLADLVVVEVADGVAAPFAARLLSDCGARVVKVERPGGDETRAWHGDDHVPDRSATYFAFNHGKSGVVLDLETDAGTAELDALLAECAVLVEDGRLDVARIADAFPHLVIVSVTPFGRSGPDCLRPGTELVAYAAGGAMWCTGLPEREPLYLGGNLVQAQAGSVAALAALGAVMAAEATGRGQWIDVAWVDAEAGSFDRAVSQLLAYEYEGVNSRREDPLATGQPRGLYPCADGEVVINTIGSTIGNMVRVLGSAELGDIAEQPALVFTDDGRTRTDRVVREWLTTRGRADATRVAQAGGWSVTPVNDLLDAADDPWLVEAGAWVEVDGGPIGRVRIPAPAFTTDGGPEYRGPAPRLGGS